MKTAESNNYGFGPIHIEGKGYGKVVGYVGNPPTFVRVQFKDGKEDGFTGEVFDFLPEKLRKANTVEPLMP